MLGRLKLYAIAGAAFVLGLLGIYWRGRSDGASSVEARTTKQRLDIMKQAKEVEDEVEILDDVGLGERAAQWMRKSRDQ
jgi:hypothetical protein|tara:strand:- start:3270 stop:3506 length:237 start_codon:yes stop_codon:yes gene_type:complete